MLRLGVLVFVAVVLAGCDQQPASPLAQPTEAEVTQQRVSTSPTGAELHYAIYEVQGSGSSSPLKGSILTIRGVVTADFQEEAELSGFFVQELIGDENPETSDGIFVFHFSTPVEVGDVVEVTGQVKEHFELTELTNVTEVAVVDQADLPQPADVRLPLVSADYWERYEGMLVTVARDGGPLTVSETFHLGRGGLVMIADSRLVQYTQTNTASPSGYAAHVLDAVRRSILLDDGSLEQNPDPIRYSATGGELTADDTLRVGDTLASVTGVVTYSFNGWSGTNSYRIHPTESVQFGAGNPPPAAAPSVGGGVRVGSFNVLNFFNGNGRGGGFPTDRGAESPVELQRQLDKLVSAITLLDAHVLGLIEIENDVAGADSAVADLVEALNAEAGSGTYDYIETGRIGDDAIKVGLIYQGSAVTPVGDFLILDSSVDPAFDDTLNRPALAQTFAQSGSGGEFTVVVNHLKSKGSSCSEFGDVDRNDGQGNCNLTRTSAARAVADWAEDLARASGDPDVLVLGDLNAYAQEDPIQALLSGGFVNLLEPDEYSYVFQGLSGTLDHALSTASLNDQVIGASVWNINAQEPSALDYNVNFKTPRQVDLLYSDSPYRSSDHDPVLVGLELNRPPDCGSANADIERLWPVDHKMVSGRVVDVFDPEGDNVTITIERIFQDEPVLGSNDGATSPDAAIGFGNHFELRAERDGEGNGRVYVVAFTANDRYGSCSGQVLVGAPLSLDGSSAVDDGALFDSTAR
ncbi:MAG: ExeM/NucH family extracellular endonuclease [Trueperaceae bacterium]